MDGGTELRKLPPSAVFKLCQLLDAGNAWQEVMAIIPTDPMDPNSEAKYSLEHIKLIETASEKQNRSCTEILLDEWGTSGKTRPTINTLLEVLLTAQFYRAADFVAVDLLHDEPPPRPADGPAASVDLTLEASRESSAAIATGTSPAMIPVPRAPQTDRGLGRPPSDDAYLSLSIAHVPFSVLVDMTDNFDDAPLAYVLESGGSLRRVGRKLGTGAFGTVYLGQTTSGRKVAVKKLAVDAATLKNQFENEIFALSEYRHDNLVPLLGFSCDTENYCLVYEFMANGSLLDRLQMTSWSPGGDTNVVLDGMASANFDSVARPLHWTKRLDIAVDVCRGIHHLHTFKATPLIHRDVKTANVLLDERLVAKLGDFGLVKVKTNASETKLVTTTVFGTSAYMAPEAFRGDVSVKMDIFSFGVVLLELLTGLPPYDETRDGCDLVTYIEDVVDDDDDDDGGGGGGGGIDFLLDDKAGEWPRDTVARDLFQLAQRCLQDKRKRPVAKDVLDRLEDIRRSS